MKKYLEKLVYNPFFVYVAVWFFALLFYSFRWSDTFPYLSNKVICFIISTNVFALFLGSRINLPRLDFNTNRVYLWNVSLYMLSITSILFLITFIVKGFPIVEIVFSNRNFVYSNYRGIQFVTITAVAVNTVSLSLYLTAYKILRDKKYLILILIAILPLVILFNRLFAMTTFLPLVFAWGILSKDKVYKYLVRAAVIVFIAIFLFGLAGNYREEAKKRGEKVNFYDNYIGQNYPSYLNQEFFWGYFYLTSPIGKFQYVTEDSVFKNRENDYIGLVLLEMLPNAMGSRLNGIIKREVRSSDYGYPVYFAGTAYRKAFLYGRWLGIIAYSLVFFSVILLLFKRINSLNSVIRPALLGNLCTVSALSVFTNTLMLTIFYLVFGVGVILSFILSRLEKCEK